MPRLHQSTSFEWPTPMTTSGARYSGVPQNVCACLPGSYRLDSPKSVSRRWPSRSSRMFSGLRSR